VYNGKQNALFHLKFVLYVKAYCKNVAMKKFINILKRLDAIR